MLIWNLKIYSGIKNEDVFYLKKEILYLSKLANKKIPSHGFSFPRQNVYWSFSSTQQTRKRQQHNTRQTTQLIFFLSKQHLLQFCYWYQFTFTESFTFQISKRNILQTFLNKKRQFRKKKNTNEIVMSFSFVVFADNTFVSRYLKTTIDSYNITKKVKQ